MGTKDDSVKREVKVREGFEYSTHIVSIYDKTEYYYNSFVLASSIVTEIVNKSDDYNLKVKACEYSEDSYILSYPNNIISFCADRGQGKTSAMVSMAEALKNVGSDMSREQKAYWKQHQINYSSTDDNNPVVNTHFEVLNPIDPTLMGNKDSVVRNIVSKMFKNATQKWRDSNIINSDAGFQKSKDQLLQHFLHCFRCIDYLHRDSSNEEMSFDDLTLLASFGDSTNLKQLIKRLVELYLDFMTYGCRYQKCMLIIQIDDADNNTKRAYDIAEEIRKYFVVPGVIVFMAMHMGTMSRTIEQHFIEDYAVIIDKKSDNKITEKCHKMMERYLDKLIPSNHQIHLPNIKHVINNEYDRIDIKYLNSKNEQVFVFNDGLLNKNREVFNFQEKLIMLIYQKTGIILVEPDGYLHDFLPNNLRELNHFISLMYGMDDVVTVEDGEIVGNMSSVMKLVSKCCKDSAGESERFAVMQIANRRVKNLRRLQEYLLKSWCPMHLDSEQQRIIEDIHNASRAAKNLCTLELVKEYSKRCDVKRDADVETATGKSNVPFSEIIMILKQLEDKDNPQSVMNFVTAIRLYYSIYFHITLFNGLRDWLRGGNTSGITPFKNIVQLINYRLFPEAFYITKGINSLEIDLSQFEQGGGIDNNLYRILLHFVCSQKNEKAVYYSKAVEKVTDNSYRASSEYGVFDCLRPIASVLGEDDVPSTFFAYDKERGQILPAHLLIILCNTDVQDLLYRKYFVYPKIFKNLADEIRKNPQCKFPRSQTSDVLSGIYKDIDDTVNKNIVMNEEIHCADIFNVGKFDRDAFNKLKNSRGSLLILGIPESSLIKGDDVRPEVSEKKEPSDTEAPKTTDETDINPENNSALHKLIDSYVIANKEEPVEDDADE